MIIEITLIYFFLAFVLFRIVRFFLTPFFRKIGLLKYYSPMFCVLKMSKKTYDFHLGTSRDFFDNRKSITPKRTLLFLAKGLVALCSEIEKGNIKQDVTFRGNTFYLKETTAAKFGFKVRKMNVIETIMFMQNYLELCVLNSILHKRLTFVQMKNVRIVYVSAADITANKKKFEKVINMFEPAPAYKLIEKRKRILRKTKVAQY